MERIWVQRTNHQIDWEKKCWMVIYAKILKYLRKYHNFFFSPADSKTHKLLRIKNQFIEYVRNDLVKYVINHHMSLILTHLQFFFFSFSFSVFWLLLSFASISFAIEHMLSYMNQFDWHALLTLYIFASAFLMTTRHFTTFQHRFRH